MGPREEDSLTDAALPLLHLRSIFQRCKLAFAPPSVPIVIASTAVAPIILLVFVHDWFAFAARGFHRSSIVALAPVLLLFSSSLPCRSSFLLFFYLAAKGYVRVEVLVIE